MRSFYTDKIKKRLEDAIKSADVSEPLPKLPHDIIEWTEKTRIISGQPFSFDGREYLHQIARETAREVYIVKGRQMELTELVVNKIMHHGSTYPFNEILYMTTRWDDTRIFSNHRLRDAGISTSPIWQQLIKARIMGELLFKNSSIAYFKSAKNRYDLARGKAVNLLILDEMQSQEVAYIDVAKEATSKTGGQIFGIGTGAWEGTDWHKRWSMGTQYEWDQKKKAWLVKAIGPVPEIHSYHIPQWIYPGMTPEKYAKKRRSAQSESQAVMEMDGWWVKGEERPITEEMLRKCFDASLKFAKPTKYPVFIGIDWGGYRHTVLWIMECRDDTIPLFRLLYCTRLETGDTDEQVNQVNNIIEQYNPVSVTADIGGATHQPQRIRERWGELVTLCRYTTDMENPLDLRKIDTDGHVNANRTITLDGTIDIIKNHHESDGITIPRIQIPYSDPALIDWTIPQFTSIQGVLVDAGGHRRMKYEKKPEDRDDILHSFNYARIAYLVWKEEQKWDSVGIGSTQGPGGGLI